MTRSFVFGLLTLGLFSLAVGWTMGGYWSVGLALLLLIPFALFLVKRKFVPTLSLFFSLTVLIAAFGLWRKINLSLMLLAVYSALAAWDLDGFSRRLSFASTEDNPVSIERQHLLLVGLILLLVASVNYLSLFIRYESNFERAVVLVIVAFGGIGALVGWLRRKES